MANVSTTKLEFYAGKTLTKIPEPQNWQSLLMELSFENDSPDAVLNISELIWMGDQAKIMNDWFNGGMNGDVGIFEGVPLQIKICDSQDIIFDGIIDLTDPGTIWNCDIVKAKISDINIDRFNALAGTISFAYLATGSDFGGPAQNKSSNIGSWYINPTVRNITNILKGSSTGGDYIPILYQNQTQTDYVELMLLANSIYQLIEKTIAASEKIVPTITAIGADVAGLNFGAAVGDLIKLIAEIIYFLLLVLVIYEILNTFYYLCVEPTYQKLGMFTRDLFQVACNYFEFTFVSSIFAVGSPYYNEVMMPEKRANAGNNTFSLSLLKTSMSKIGAPSTTVGGRMMYDDVVNLQANVNNPFIGAYGYYDGTISKFISDMEIKFNAKAKIIRNVATGKNEMHFERWDSIFSQSTYTLPDISDQSPFPISYGTNASKIDANYEVMYQEDTVDEHTITNYNGTSCYCTLTPVIVDQLYNVVLQNINQKQIPFAQATRKNKRSSIEEILGVAIESTGLITEVFIDSYNAIANLVNSLSHLFNFTALPTIPSPEVGFPFILGQLQLTNHLTSVPKVFIAGDAVTTKADPTGLFESRKVSGVTVSVDNKDGEGYETANNMMRDFHYSNLGKTVTPWNLPGLDVSSPNIAGQEYCYQYKLYKNQKIALCCADYNLIKSNNIIKTFDGKVARVDSLRWNLFTGMAEIDYRVNEKFTNNLQTTFIIDGLTTESKL